jgi:flagellar operon protein (TIGR03826 family)
MVCNGVIQMALANCPQCGKLFNKTFRDVCPDCVRLEEEQFHTVREYLHKHRNAKPFEVSEATEVPVQTIYKFVREGRLQATYYDGLHYECEECGKAIITGKYCKDCTEVLTRNVKKLQDHFQEKGKKSEAESKTTYHFKFKDQN